MRASRRTDDADHTDAPTGQFVAQWLAGIEHPMSREQEEV
jgi:hypothetical protein